MEEVFPYLFIHAKEFTYPHSYSEASIRHRTTTINVSKLSVGFSMFFMDTFLYFRYFVDFSVFAGGRNGFGAKLCNIFSDEFIVESVSSHKMFSQVCLI